MNKLSKIFLIIIILLLIIIVILGTWSIKNFNIIKKSAKDVFENSIILEAAGIEISTDDEGYYTVTDTTNGNILKSNFKVNINEDGTYTIINK